ncbi:hypothetical protein MMC21_008035 [Puttea exsequens]|nr:hypothetical protein [Puttea exsequens]
MAPVTPPATPSAPPSTSTKKRRFKGWVCEDEITDADIHLKQDLATKGRLFASPTLSTKHSSTTPHHQARPQSATPPPHPPTPSSPYKRLASGSKRKRRFKGWLCSDEIPPEDTLSKQKLEACGRLFVVKAPQQPAPHPRRTPARILPPSQRRSPPTTPICSSVNRETSAAINALIRVSKEAQEDADRAQDWLEKAVREATRARKALLRATADAKVASVKAEQAREEVRIQMLAEHVEASG